MKTDIESTELRSQETYDKLFTGYVIPFEMTDCNKYADPFYHYLMGRVFEQEFVKNAMSGSRSVYRSPLGARDTIRTDQARERRTHHGFVMNNTVTHFT